MSFNPTRGPHVTLCNPRHEDFNLKLIYSSNGKDDRVEHVVANLACRTVYCTSWWIIVRNVLKIRPLYLLCLQALQDFFMCLVRTIAISLLGSQVIDFPVSKVWLLLLHPADDNRQLYFLTTRREIPFSPGNVENSIKWTQKSRCPCPYTWYVETDKMVVRVI